MKNDNGNLFKGFHIKDDWQNQSVTAINREPAHMQWGAYKNEIDRYYGGDSVAIFNLDGVWQFALADTVGDVPDGFFEADFDGEFGEINVPGCWELQGYDKPVYVNTLYPFVLGVDAPYLTKVRSGGSGSGNGSGGDDASGGGSGTSEGGAERDAHEEYTPPFVPEKQNHVGLYRRSFSFPAQFEHARRDVFLRCDGVEGAYYLWVNGHPVGYSQDSKLPSEFEISQYLNDDDESENLIAMAVLRFSDGTWLEDQDYFHISGIFRSVNILAKPKRRIVDIQVDAKPIYYNYGTYGAGAFGSIFENEYDGMSISSPGSTVVAGAHPFVTGRIAARVSVNRFENYGDYRVKMIIYGPSGEQVAWREAKIDTMSRITSKWRFPDNQYKKLPQTAWFDFLVKDISEWSCDEPILYTAVVELYAPGEIKPCDCESVRLGFREIKIENNVIKLNGRRFVFRGANRHDWAWPTGRTVSTEHMIAEIRLMKELNFNAVRTCHYPDDPRWYDLCDEYGIVVVCEANVETHGVSANITHDPEWSSAMLERARRMVCIHKNHPSIVSWSLGNESGFGPNHAAMANWIREYDPTRLVQYENCDPGSIGSDIKCSMYPPIEAIMQMIADNEDRRPIVLVEYAYQIANSGGGLEQFNYLVENFEIFQGGFMWDWQDKCLPAKTEGGAVYYGYGGDWGEEIVDWECPEYMVANGAVLPDLTPKPCARELKQAQAPVIIEKGRGDSVYIFKNRFHSLSSLSMRCEATTSVEGVVIGCEDVELPNVAAGRDGKFIYKPGEYQTSSQKMTTWQGEIQDKGQMPQLGPEPESEQLQELEQASHKPFHGTSYKPETYVTFSVFSTDNGRLQREHAIASYQFCLRGRKATFQAPVAAGTIKTESAGNTLIARGDSFEIAFDLESGLISRYERGGALYFSGGAENVSRARCGMHLERKWWGLVNDIWDAAKPGALTRECIGAAHSAGGDWVQIYVHSILKGAPGDILTQTIYNISGDGSIKVDVEMDIDSGFVHVPRTGIGFIVEEGFEDLTWYGRGPGESYPDRKLAALVGRYSSTVEGTHFPFVPPSHNGTHVDTRWLALGDENGREIKIDGTGFAFDVHHNTVEEYWNARHEHELIRHKESYLYLDGCHAGIGGDMAWSTEINEKHLVPAGLYRYGFVISTK